jgi:beta-glucosidase
LSVRWARDNVPAILEAYYAGEEGGNAIADVLFGNSNPGAKLPYTVYESTAQIPPQSEYDISRGFTYMYFQAEPVFPFGHGLSYTQFEYGRVHLSHRHVSTDGRLNVRLDVRNVGQRSGSEVVQLYAHRISPIGVPVPIKKLVGFRKIQLEAGEQATVRFEVPADQLAIYDEAQHDFVVEPGVFKVLVGSSSEDIRAKAHFLVTASRNQTR